MDEKKREEEKERCWWEEKRGAVKGGEEGKMNRENERDEGGRSSESTVLWPF